jgi:hypothetical protein
MIGLERIHPQLLCHEVKELVKRILEKKRRADRDLKNCPQIILGTVWGHKKRPFRSPERPMKCGFCW